MSREKTIDEVKQAFLDEIEMRITYWENLPDKTIHERLDGLAFSILVVLDGCSSLPAFIVAPDPAPSDKQYYIEEEKNYYPENYNVNVECNISGGLHESFGK